MPAILLAILIAFCAATPVFGAQPLAPDARLVAIACAPESANVTMVVQIPNQARYAIFLEGDRGCSLSVHDRMYGVLGAASIPRSPTEAPVRYTAFLEAGEYQIRVSKDKGAKATVVVQRFTELPPCGLSEPGELRECSLSDLQVLSFPVRVDARHPRLEFFAMGRSLGGMALFGSGQWDTGIECQQGTFETAKGHPTSWCEYARDLPPGDYTVLLWGSPPLDSEAGGLTSDALFVAQGRRLLDEIGVFRIKLGNSGLASWSIPGSVTEVQATSLSDAVVRVLASTGESPRLSADESAITDLKGAYRTATLDLMSTAKSRWISVSGPAGTEVDLRLLPRIEQGRVGVGLTKYEAGLELLRFLGAVSGADAAPVTAWVYRQDGRDESPSLLAERSLNLSAKSPLHLEGNLLSRLGLLVRVEQGGEYTVLEKDTEKCSATWTFTPLGGFGLDLKAARNLTTGKAARLEAGLYLLSVNPEKPGVMNALVAETGLQTKVGGGSLWKTPVVSSGNELAWPPLSLPRTSSSVSLGLALGERGGVELGFSRRKLPAEISRQSLGILIGAKESLEFPVKLEDASSLRLFGPAVQLAVDGSPWSAAAVYEAGQHRLSFSGGEHAAWVSIESLPVIAPSRSEDLLAFEEGKASWNEFSKGETKRFLLTVKESSLYAVSTTGRLATSISIRTPLRVSLASNTGGGAGRNSLVMAWLRPGRYLVEVGVKGLSAGWAGVTLERKEIRALESLKDGKTLRATVDGGDSVAIPLAIDRDGTWSIGALGLGRSFSFRLEDSDGWPVQEPVYEGEQRMPLRAGSYRYISLPDPVPTRRVFSLNYVPQEVSAEELAVRKEFALGLGVASERRWRGTGPDVARINLPVALEASFSLDPSMLFKLIDASGAVLAAGVGGDLDHLSLPAGESRLELSPVIPDEDHGYAVGIDSPALFEGRTLPVAAGTILPMVATRSGSWELSTSGSSELEFALFKVEGASVRLVSTGERIADDWNSRLRTTLGPGTYLVKVSGSADPSLVSAPSALALSPAADGANSRMCLRYRAEQPCGSFSVPFSTRAGFGAGGISVDGSFELASPVEGPCHIRASSNLPVDLRLERDGRTIATGRDELLVVLSKGARYHLVAALEGEGALGLELSASLIAAGDISLAADGTFDASAQSVLIRDSGGPSRLCPDGQLLVASGPDAGFTAIPSGPFLADGAWLLRKDLMAIGRQDLSPLSIDGSGTAALALTPGGQRVFLSVAPDTVSLVRLAAPGAEASITDRHSPVTVDWSSASIRRDATLLGLASGEHRLTLRDSGRALVAREAVFSAARYPVTARLTSENARGSKGLSVAPGTALAVDLSPRAALRLSLGKGLVAFVSDGERTILTVEADRESGSFSLTDPDGKSLAGTLWIVHQGGLEAGVASLSDISSSAVASSIPVTGKRPGEAQLPAPAVLSFRIDGKEGEGLFAIGSIRSARFLDEDSGAALPALPWTPSPGQRGPEGLLSFAGRRGVLRLELDAGWYRVFLAREAEVTGALLGPDVTRAPVTLDAASPLLFARSSGAGLLAVRAEDGRLLSFAASVAGQSLLVPLAPGRYTVATRPFAGSSLENRLTVQAVRAESLDAQTKGAPRLLAPGELEAFRFTLDAPSRVGASVRADSDALVCRLYTADLSLIDVGPLFYLELGKGSYYFVVESTTATVRYEPVILGLGEK